MTILMILTAAAVPVVRVTIQRSKEKELRRALWEMRDAIDRYKDQADRGAFQIKVDSQGYPPDLYSRLRGLQPGAHAESGGCSSGGVSRGRSVSRAPRSRTPRSQRHRKSDYSMPLTMS